MTKKLYLDDACLLEFESSVVDVRKSDDGFEVILQSTAFYPESGGQPYDLGLLDDQKVLEVIEDDNGRVIHKLENWTALAGTSVKGVIDRARRLDNMRRHTGQHILSQAFIRVANAHTASAHLGEVESTIELSIESLDGEAMRKAELLANDIIFENQPVKINYYSREELDNLPVRKIPKREGKFRIVQVAEFDCTACGGTHCRQTGEIGMIKIIGQEKIRGHIRISFLCGRQALEDYYWKDKVISRLSGKLTCHFQDVNDTVDKLQRQNTDLRKEIIFLNKKLLPNEVNRLKNDACVLGNVRLMVETYKNKDPRDIKELGNNLSQSFDSITLLANDDRIFIFVSDGVKTEASKLARLFMERYGGRGGGGSTFAQIGGISAEKIQYFLNKLVEIVKNEISR